MRIDKHFPKLYQYRNIIEIFCPEKGDDMKKVPNVIKDIDEPYNKQYTIKKGNVR